MYTVNDFSGGMQIYKDSSMLNPNEALDIYNLMFDNAGSLTKRHGINYWSINQCPSGETLKTIYYLNTTTGKSVFLAATQKYIYKNTTIDSSLGWTNKLGYNKGTVKIYHDDSLVYGTNTWWLVGIKEGDSLVIGDSTYGVHTIKADTCFSIGRTFNVASDSGLSYKITRTLVGEPYITSWNNKTYIADKHSPAFVVDDSSLVWLNLVDSGIVDWREIQDTVWYDTVGKIEYYGYYNYNSEHNRYGWFFERSIYIDDGNIYDTIATLLNQDWIHHNETFIARNDSIYYYQNASDTMYDVVAMWQDTTGSYTGFRYLAKYSTYDSCVSIRNSFYFKTTDSLRFDTLFVHLAYNQNPNNYPTTFYERSPIHCYITHKVPQSNYYATREMLSAVDDEDHQILCQTWGQEGTRIYGGNYSDTSARIWTPAIIDSTYSSFNDTSKYLDQDEYSGYYIVPCRNANRYLKIESNSYNTYKFSDNDTGLVTSDSVINLHDRYYIFESIPYNNTCPDSIESSRLDNIYFHKNILFATGYELYKGDTVESGTIYNSEVGLPNKGTTFNGFNLTLNAEDRPTAMFTLNDYLILASSNKIFSLSGNPPSVDNNGVLIEVINGVGIHNKYAYATRDKNYAYIYDDNRFYKFNGGSLLDISEGIYPLVKKYAGANGYRIFYYDNNVYFSSVDSNMTFVYNEPLTAFSRMSVGFDIANTQQSILSRGYMLFLNNITDPRRIFKYPNSIYMDKISPTVTDTFDITYETGWIDFGNITNRKRLFNTWNLITKEASSAKVYLKYYIDFNSDVYCTDSIYTPSLYFYENMKTINRFKFPIKTKCDLMKLKVESGIPGNIAIGRFSIEFGVINKENGIENLYNGGSGVEP